MSMDNCYARSFCTKYQDDEQCNYGCVAFHQMNVVYDLSRIPKKYRYELPLVPDEIDLEQFKQLRQWIDVKEEESAGNRVFRHNVKEKIQQGEGLFLWSESKGNGKTSWALKIMQAYFRAVALHNNLQTKGLYISVPEFLEDMRRSMDDPSPEHRELLRLAKTVDLVLFDDIGTESPTKWVREQLYIIINSRESNGLSSIFTSNLSLAQLGHPDYLGERIASRIEGSCDIVHLQGRDKRRSSKEAKQR